MQILSVASEIYPIVKTGGLADVVGALPSALAKFGAKVTTLIPGYNYKKGQFSHEKLIFEYSELFGSKARLISCKFGDLDLVVLDAPSFYKRKGGPYIDVKGKDYTDNPTRFAALSKVAADLAGGNVSDFLPDLIHAHDWQAALAPVFMKYGNARAQNTPSILTIHNIAFQGRYNSKVYDEIGLNKCGYAFESMEFYGDTNFLKAGIGTCDYITTVSPQYAQEILTPEFGMGLDGVIRAQAYKLSGILNGIDIDVWNPKTDKLLVENYDYATIINRKANKRALENIFGLNHTDRPLFCVISRLTEQKGIDILVSLFDAITHLGVRLAILGSGDPMFETEISNAAQSHKGNIGVKVGYDEELSHLMQGGSDAILIPSRFEPCGLTQLYGLRYGCVPIVARNGGLSDTIIDANNAAIDAGVATGFQFANVNAHEFYNAIARAVEVYKKPELWTQMQKNGMKADVSWANSGKAYWELYEQAVKHK